MKEYQCDCCGCIFIEDESLNDYPFHDEIMCPDCGAYYNEIEEKFNS